MEKNYLAKGYYNELLNLYTSIKKLTIRIKLILKVKDIYMVMLKHLLMK